jgi:hypothetical protein
MRFFGNTFFCKFKKKPMKQFSILMYKVAGKLVFFTLFFLCACSCMTSQEMGISLVNKSKDKTVFLSQNKKIKITTSGGEKVAGTFMIVDDKRIMIKNQQVLLTEIVAIRKYSTYSAIASTASIFVGSLFTTLGTAGIIAGGYGSIVSPLAPIGLTMVLIPALSNKHKSKKWDYKIVKLESIN